MFPKYNEYKYLYDSFGLQDYHRNCISYKNIGFFFLKKYPCRWSEHRVAIEQGRYNQTARLRRICTFCAQNSI